MIRDKKKKVAFIYEGVKTEANLFHNLQESFFNNTAELVIVTLPADGNIYMLWNRLREDEFETDLISVLKEMNTEVAEKLKQISVEDFSEIYLFFDYDGHNDNVPVQFRDRDVLAEMLKTFDNETELGKLYISYPMIESIKEISIKDREYKTLYLPLKECADYKQTVGGVSDYGDFRYITKEMWHIACEASLKRACLIVLFRTTCTYEEFINLLSQEKIYDAQKKNCIIANNMIGVLNAIPLFLIEYYGENVCVSDSFIR